MKKAKYITTALMGILLLTATSYADQEDTKTQGDGDQNAQKRGHSMKKMEGRMRDGDQHRPMRQRMNGDEGRRRGRPEGMEHGSIIEKILQSEKLCKELNITDEQKADMLKQSEELKAQAKATEEKLRAAAEEQAELMKAEEIDQDAVMAKIDEIGGYRTEFAKLRVKQLFMMRSSLTEEQLATLKEKRQKFEEKRKEMQERMKERMKEGRDRGQGDNRDQEWRHRQHRDRNRDQDQKGQADETKGNEEN